MNYAVSRTKKKKIYIKKQNNQAFSKLRGGV